MSKYFSASAMGFYDAGIHKILPTDAVPITDELYAALLDAEGNGHVLAADNDGQPITVAYVADAGELLASMRRQRNQLLLTSDYVMMADYPLTDDQRAAWAAYRQSLRDLPETTTDPAAITWPVAPTGA